MQEYENFQSLSLCHLFKVNMPSWPFCCELQCNSVHKVSSPIKPNVEITAAHDYYVAGVGRRRGVTTARLWADWRRPADTAGPHQPRHAPGSETVTYPGNGFFVTAFAIFKRPYKFSPNSNIIIITIQMYAHTYARC